MARTIKTKTPVNLIHLPSWVEPDSINGIYFPGFFEISPYIWNPCLSDFYVNVARVKMGRTAARLARSTYKYIRSDCPYYDSIGLARKMVEEMYPDPSTNAFTDECVRGFYKNTLKLNSTEIKNISVFRKRPIGIPTNSPAIDQLVWAEVANDSIKPFDVITRNRFCDQGGDIITMAKFQLVSDLHEEFAHNICIHPQDPLCGLSYEDAYNVLSDKGFGPYMHVYRPTKIVPYGIGRKLPMNKSFSEALPLP